MFHDHHAFSRLCAKMRNPGPTREPLAAPPLAELIARVEAAVERRRRHDR